MDGYNNPLMDINYFHVNIHEKSHRELNGVLEKKYKINTKTVGYPKRKNKRKEWLSSFLTFKGF
jgi:hypothetical protein